MAKKKSTGSAGKKSIFKLRTAIIFGTVALLVLCAGIILLFSGIRNAVTPYSYPESTLTPMPGETKFFEHNELTVKIAIPGTTYSLYVPDGTLAGDNSVFFDTYGQVTYAVTYSDNSAESWITGDLNKGVLNFYADGKESSFAAYVNDVGYLNGYEMEYFAGVTDTTALGQDNEVYSVTYELMLDDGNYLLLSAATLNKNYLATGKTLLDAMVYTLVLDDDGVKTEDSSEQENEDVTTLPESDYTINEDGHIVGEVDGVWYEYLNMQDYVNTPWKEEVLEDGRYGYVAPISRESVEDDIIYIEVFYTPEDMQNYSFEEDAYITCTDKGAINYNVHIKPFSIQGNYLYFQVQNYESDYSNYVLIGTSDVPMEMFSPYVYTSEEWVWYMNLYPGDPEWGVTGYELPDGWEQITVEAPEAIEGEPMQE